MAVVLSPLGGAGAQFFDNDGTPLAGGLLYTYAAGTTTPASVYTTSAGNVAHANPIVLDAGGRVTDGQIWLTVGTNYKFVLTDGAGASVGTWDNIEPPVDTETVTGSLVAPAGTVWMYGGSSAPTGWLLCDGSIVSTTTYADLYAVIGTAFNTGAEGAGNFRLPDFRGRSPLGVGTGTSLTARALGARGGAETHILVTGEVPSHTHNIDHTHSFNLPDHTHSEYVVGDSATELTEAAVDGLAPFLPTNTATNTGGVNGTPSGTTGAASASNSGAAGGGGAHNNMQPWLALNFIIRT